MGAVRRIALAGLCYRLHPPVGHALGAFRPSYEPFLIPPEAPDEGEPIDVFIERGDTARPVGFEGVFQSGQSWAMYRSGCGEYLLEVAPLPGGLPMCSLRFTPGGREVRALCSDDMFGGLVADNLFCYPTDRLLAMMHLAVRGGVQAHSACVMAGGRGHVFMGVSGAGKSTLARLFREAPGALVVTDERTIIRADGRTGGYVAHGTPWPGDAEIAVSASAPLGGLYFLRQAGENSLRPMGTRESLARLLNLVTVPWYDEGLMAGTLGLLGGILGGAPVYEFWFRPEPGAVAHFMGQVAGE